MLFLMRTNRTRAARGLTLSNCINREVSHEKNWLGRRGADEAKGGLRGGSNIPRVVVSHAYSRASFDFFCFIRFICLLLPFASFVLFVLFASCGLLFHLQYSLQSLFLLYISYSMLLCCFVLLFVT